MTSTFVRDIAADAATRHFAGVRRRLPLALCLLALIGCTTEPPPSPYSGADPATAASQAAPVTDTDVLGNYVSRRPVSPGSWREQNERVAPRRQP